MNWCMVAICAACVPLLLLFKERYSRFQLDAANIQAKGSGAGDGERTPLVQSERLDSNNDIKRGGHSGSTMV